MKSFEDNILGIIDKFSYEFYVVIPNEEVKCVCVDHTTKQPNPGCKKCLGTGNKIVIKKIKGAVQDTDIPPNMRPTGDTMIARLYFTPVDQIILKENDLIIDNNKVFYVYQPRMNRGFNGKEVYQKTLACAKKLQSKILLKNFNEKIGR